MDVSGHPCYDSHFLPCITKRVDTPLSMCMSQQAKYKHIERNNVTEGDPEWTEGKEEAAQIIQELIDRGEWPVSLSKLDDETSWSRSHFRNTLDDLFQIVDAPESDSIDERDSGHQENNQTTITVPDDVDRISYIKGWLDREKQLR